MDSFVPLSVPNLKDNSLKYLTQAIETEWVSTSGPFVNDFEKAAARYVGAPLAVACQSGTAGLHLAMIELGVGPGDLVLAPALTFIAAVNPIVYQGAEPVFLDCDDSLCIDPVKLGEYCGKECTLQDGRLVDIRSGKRVAALVVVHVFGNMADLESITDICGRYSLPLIEDATEALGTKYLTGRFAGMHAGTIGDIGVYSFNGNKIITTGGGGMIVGKDQRRLEHIRKLSIQAKNGESDHFYDHDEIGYNYRLTNLQAALGVAQMESLPGFVGIKGRLYERYLEHGLDLLPFREGTRPNRWMFSFMTNGHVREYMEGLRERRIETRPIWKLIPTLRPYRDARAYRIERAPFYQDNVLNIPCSTNLTEQQQDRVIAGIREIARTL